MLSAFSLKTLELLDNLAPYKERTLRRNPVPWFSKDLRMKFKQRDRLYARAKRSNSSVLRERYKQLRKRLKSELKAAREKFFTEKLRNSPDPSSIWSLLNKFGVIGSYRNSPLATFSPDELNSCYATVASAHPLCSNPEVTDILTIPLNHDLPIFDLALLDTVIVYQTALSILPKANGSSADDLYFKDVLGLVAKYITEIFNVSIRTGVYPKLWKMSLIVPLNKVSSPTYPSDTRPIANLPHLAKVFDKLVSEQLIDFLESDDLLTPHQSGFRRCYSTQDALIKISEDIRCGIDKGLYTILIMFDFKKAFDTLRHSTLLRIMRKLNFSDATIRWFHLSFREISSSH